MRIEPDPTDHGVEPGAGGDSTRRAIRPTQADIARLAGVSQATVSFVISGNADVAARVAPETRDRVLDAIRKAGYVVNPAARRLASGRNSLLGIYTFESVFPVQERDFYYPFLLGIEEEAGAHDYDMLLFTSATGADGRRSIFAGGVNRLGLADGCVLLGRDANRDELVQLIDEGYPFVYIGRRDVPGRSLAYVTADYATATREVVARLAGLGHRTVAYVGLEEPMEPDVDRERGYGESVSALGLNDATPSTRVSTATLTPELLHTLVAQGVTALVVGDGEPVFQAASQAGIAVPQQLSVAVLGDPIGAVPEHLKWSGFHLPRTDMGKQAVQLLLDVLDSTASGPLPHRVLPCVAVAGETVQPPPDSLATTSGPSRRSPRSRPRSHTPKPNTP